MKQQKKNRFYFESEEVRNKCINEVIGFFQTERNEEIGTLAAAQILDFFLEKTGEEIYRKALQDTKKLLRERFDSLEVDLDLLLPQ